MRLHVTAILCSVLLAVCGVLWAFGNTASAAPQDASIPNAASVAKPHAYVSLDPVPRGREFQAAVVVDIARGFHMNSHKPSEEYLIPTTLTPQLPAGFQLTDTVYPNGRLEKFAFSPDKPLNVYTGSVTLKLRLLAQAGAPLGPATIPLTLRYQACNDAACLPPVKIPVSIQLNVAAAGTKAQPSHPEIFSAMSPKAARK
ncbi:MAG: protein-disulfide reductase DsbD domain-containing protein [Candidatus Acidiferrales bacterium]